MTRVAGFVNRLADFHNGNLRCYNPNRCSKRTLVLPLAPCYNRRGRIRQQRRRIDVLRSRSDDNRPFRESRLRRRLAETRSNRCSLHDHQRVEIMVTALEEPQYRADPELVQQLHEKANEWLAQQPAAAVREPRRFSQAKKSRLDAEFDQLMAEIQAASGADDEAELAALVDEAVAASAGIPCLIRPPQPSGLW